MPAADSAISKPTKSSAARVALAAILRRLRFAVAPLSSCASTAADTHSAITITTTTDSVPSIRLRKVTCAVPIFQPMSSSASITVGQMPVTHSATPSHATHETQRSMRRIGRDAGKATVSTRTVRRITASDTRIGTASLNTASGTTPVSPQRAPSAAINAINGKSTPSTSRSPKRIEACRGAVPRSRRVAPQANSRQPASTAASVMALGLASEPSSSAISSAVSGRVMGRELTVPPALSNAPRRCVPARPDRSRLRGRTRCALARGDRPRLSHAA